MYWNDRPIDSHFPACCVAMSAAMANLNPAATAVLVIDAQVGVFETDPAPLDKRGVLARIAALR